MFAKGLGSSRPLNFKIYPSDRVFKTDHSQRFPAAQTSLPRKHIRRCAIKAASPPESDTSTSFPALKEWAPAVTALLNGEQTVLLRKGGIKEPTFTPKASQFLLFPTAFHTDDSLLKSDLQARYNADCLVDPKSQSILNFNCLAEVTGTWATTDPNVLAALDALHIYGPNFLNARLRWRPTQPLTILEVRAYRLELPVVMETREELWGCFSWVDIDAPQGIRCLETLKQAGIPALDEAAFAERQRLCREGLAKLADLKEVHY